MNCDGSAANPAPASGAAQPEVKRTLWRRFRMEMALVGCVALLAVASARAQGSKADYDRAAGLSRAFANKVFRDRVEPRWLPDNAGFWYELKTGPETREFILVNTENGARQPAFDHGRLAEALTAAGVEEVDRDRLLVRNLDWPGSNSLSFSAYGKQWLVDLGTYQLTENTAARSEPTGLDPEDAPRSSRRTGPETSLTFINRTQEEVELFWLDSDGQRRSYGRVRAGEQHEQRTFAGHVWLAVNRAGRTIAAFEADARGTDAIISGATTERSRPRQMPRSQRRQMPRDESPDGKWRAVIEDHNVMLRDQQSNEAFQATRDGEDGNAYRSRFHWSPDSRRVVAIRVAEGDERKVHFVESSPRDQVQPRLHSFNYLKPGDKLPRPRPVLIDVATRQAISISDDLFSNPFTETGDMDIRWAPDSSRFTFRYNQRGHQVLRMIAVDVVDSSASQDLGESKPSEVPAIQVRAMVDEQSATFIDYSGKFFLEFLDDSNELIWMSERDGWNHLYLYDARSGQVKNQITRGAWVVRGVERVDREKRQIWFRAGGIRDGQDPYYVHYARINFDGSSMVVLTEGDGHHNVQFSPDQRFLIDTFSRVDAPPVTELRRAGDGQRICELERADHRALLEAGWRAPERFVAKGRDGTTDIFGVIVRPTKFDPAQKYPVIENIYAGPQSAFTPKTFSAVPRMQELTELGFIVVQMDGMGTSHRSKQFHDVCWKNIGDAGFPDRVRWIKAAAAKYPEMDISRMGIYGTSAGGQNALGGLLAFPDFYKAGVADCGCHDNRMDKIWWNEQWMGWPVGPHYDEQSNVTQAHKLHGKLLLMVGEMDRNVDPASTTQVVNALIKANKDFEYLVVPGAGHGVAGSPYGKRRLQDFFVRHLLEKEPRWE